MVPTVTVNWRLQGPQRYKPDGRDTVKAATTRAMHAIRPDYILKPLARRVLAVKVWLRKNAHGDATNPLWSQHKRPVVFVKYIIT
jgi:hypothetical protein